MQVTTILKILLIIDYDYSKRHTFQVCDNYNTEAFLIIKWEGFPELIDLIGLITSTDFNTAKN